MDISDIRKEYNRLDALCGVDTSGIELVVSKRMYANCGMCYYGKDRKPRKIVIASFLFNVGDESVLDTARHEYAHALVKLRRPNENHQHDAVWRAAAREVGCSPRATCNDPSVEKYCEAHEKEFKRGKVLYVVRCTGCGQTWEYERRGPVVRTIQSGGSAMCPMCKGNKFTLTEGEWG